MKSKQKIEIKRSPSQGTYTVFLGLQFISKKNYYMCKDIVAAVKGAVKLAQAELRSSYPGVKLKLEYRVTKYGKPLNAQIIRMVKRASAAVFEFSEKNPNVYFEMGLAYGKKVTEPIILLNKRAARRKIVASDVEDLFRLHYSHNKLSSKKREMADHIKQQVAKRISGYRFDIRRVWSGGISKRHITVVCPTLPVSYLPKHARKSSPEFVNLAKYGDPDALVEVLILLRTLFTNSRVRRLISRKISHNDYRENLIVIGGPDFNNVAREFMRESNCPIQYQIAGSKCAFLCRPSRKEFLLKTKRRGQALQDYGLFARFPNPFNRSKTVIMIGGLGTRGVLGAAEAFGINPIGKKNTRKIVDNVSENPFFAVLIPVRVSESHTPYCEIDLATLCKYPWKQKINSMSQ